MTRRFHGDRRRSLAGKRWAIAMRKARRLKAMVKAGTWTKAVKEYGRCES